MTQPKPNFIGNDSHGLTIRKEGTEDVCPVWDDERQVFVWAYTLQGAARELGINLSEVRKLIHTGRLSPYRKSHHTGRRVFILKADVEKYLGKQPTDPIADI